MQKDRLKQALTFLREKGVEASGSYQKIAQKMGYNPNYISDLVNGRFGISEKFAEKFQEVFSINKKWLLTGDGDMVFSSFMRYPQNNTNSSQVSDMNLANKYLKGEEINMKLIREYNNIIQTLQSHITQLTENNITLANENSELRRLIDEQGN